MGNCATTIEEQILLLKKRGMQLDCPIEKIKEHLMDIGYYRLGFYWHPFEIDSNHHFKVGTKFSDVIELYYLDSDLRNILTRYINRIEINFRTKLVYTVSNHFSNHPTWFVHPTIMETDFISKFSTIYSKDFISKNKLIKKHHAKYINDRYAPAWKTLECMTFGAIIKTFNNIKDNTIRESIAKEFGVTNLKKFNLLLETVLYLRNHSAHGNILFDIHFPKGIPSIPILSVSATQRHQLYTGIRVISFLLKHISENRKNSFEERINNLFEEQKNNPAVAEIIHNNIGYMNDTFIEQA